MATSGEGADPHEEGVYCDTCGFNDHAIVNYDHDDNSWHWDCPECPASYGGRVGER